MDQEKHEVELNWGTTAGNVNDMGDSDKVQIRKIRLETMEMIQAVAFMSWKKEKN